MKKLSDIYECFGSFLLYLLEDTYLKRKSDKTLSRIDGMRKLDLYTIKRFVDIFDKGELKKVIKEGREILKLEEFPWDWIGDLANRWCETPAEYKEWVIWLTDTLEAEAKEADKF